MSTLLAGAAEVVITPPLGVDMTGYAGRPSGCSDILDDLYARALVLSDGTLRVAFVALDVLTVDDDLVGRIRLLVERETSIGADALVLNYSHTHGGPAVATLRGLGVRDEGYCDVFVRAVVGCVQLACRRLRPARIGFACENVRIGINRRERLIKQNRTIIGENPQGRTCEQVGIMKVTTTNNQPLACLFSHATHAVVFGNDNLGITGDWVGYACRYLQRWLHDISQKATDIHPVALFAQGCCGNINPMIRGMMEHARALGAAVAAAALKAWHLCQTTDVARIQSTFGIVDAPLSPPPSQVECEQLIEDQRLRVEQIKSQTDNRGEIGSREAGLQWAETLLRMRLSGSPKLTLPYEIVAVRINDCGIAALAGEVFIELSDWIQEHSPLSPTWVLAYSNGLPGGHEGWGGRGAVGYLPDARSYPEGGYEVDGAIRYYGNLMFDPSAADRVCKHAVKLLNHL